MTQIGTAPVIIDLSQFKLHLNIKNQLEMSVHFDSPSRRFYLSVLALVALEMKNLDRIVSIPLEKHEKPLAFLNETIGGHAGSSEKENLLPRIYRKWKDALPDLEFAPLFKVIGKKKEYADAAGRAYRFTETEKDCWANLFEYKGSFENVRLRFSVDKLGLSLNDVVITYGEDEDLLDKKAWDRFIKDLELKKTDKPEGVAIDVKAAKSGLPIRREGKRKPWEWVAIAVAIFLVIGAAFIAFWKFYLYPSPSIEAASLDKMAYPLPEEPSIAVLPFHNLSGDPEHEYLADGITDNIITALSQVPDMFVIARNSILTFKDKPVEIRQVSEQLGVQYVLEGSVQKEGNRMRINVQLIDALKGHHLWAKGYDREMKDFFALQDEIIIKVLTALQVKLTTGTFANMYYKSVNNLEAYLKALEADKFWYRFNKDDNRVAKQMCEEVIALDPQWAGGYLSLAWTHYMDITLGSSKSFEASLARAEELALKALELDDAWSAPHALLANIYRRRKQFDKAIASAELAVSMNPTSDHLFHLSLALFSVGRPAEAIPLLKKAIRRSPMSQDHIISLLGAVYFQSRQYEDALAVYKRILDFWKKGKWKRSGVLFGKGAGHKGLAATYAMLGQMEKAKKYAEEFLRINPEWSLERYEKWAVTSYKNRDDIDHWMNAYRRAGLK